MPNTHAQQHRRQMAMASRETLMVMALVATAALLPAAESKKATTFRVGDDSGWDVGVDYQAWAHGKKFKVGDTLEFRYHKGQDVVLVDEQSFDDCKAPKNAKPLASGDAVDVVLGQAPDGRFFFICDAKGACESGMKLAIDVHT